MTNRKVKRKSGKILNIYSDGGNTKGFNLSSLSNIGSMLGSALNQSYSNNKSGIDAEIESAIYGDSSQDPIARLIGDLTGKKTNNIVDELKREQTLGDISSNEELLEKWNTAEFKDSLGKESNFGENLLDNLAASAQGASQGAAFGPWGALIGGIAGGVVNLASLAGRNSRRNKINKAIDIYNSNITKSYENAITNLNKTNTNNILANYSSYGGYIDTGSESIFDEEFKKEMSYLNKLYTPDFLQYSNGGRIHIKKKNRGKFTDYCGGKVTAECIAKGKKSKSPAVRKRAVFAENSRKWKHDEGGPLDSIVEAVNKRSKADFMLRLKDPYRQYIKDWETGGIATHKLGYAENDNGAIVYPNVQRINNELIDFTDPKYNMSTWDALDSAIKKGDTIRMTPKQAELFTKTYKSYYPKGNTFTFGGDLLTHGGVFSNGITKIENGGTHEDNPYEGVQMGIDSEGIPNLVEQGEVKFNDYIFSNRLYATKNLLLAYNLPTSYSNHSFADIAERLSKESSERPNDPISKRGLMSAMTRLQQAQEQLRTEEQSRKYAKGGHLFAGGGPAGINPDLYDEEDDYLIVPTGSKIIGNPFAYDDAVYQAPVITTDRDTPDISSRQGRGLTWLRYAPVVGAGLGVLTDALGWTNKPDYGNADLVGSAVDNLTNVGFTPIGNYLTYRPLDRNYYINKLNAQAGAIRRAIVNQSGGNRATALAGLLAADYNAQSALGDLARQAEEYNFNQRKDVETFNRGTNQFNSEMGLKASIANRANDKLRLQARTIQAKLRDQADARASAGRASNLTNLFDSLGEIGREEFSRNMIQTNPALYYSIDSSGRITYKNGYEDLSEAEKKVVRDAANKAKGKKKAKGGYLTIRKGK